MSAKPKNFQEMYEFYRELAKVNPWPTTKFGGYTEKGTRIDRQMNQDELDESARKAAEEMGWTIPEPIFEEEPF